MQQETQRRMTTQRKLILEKLKSVKTHPTAEELYLMVKDKLPKISLGTVYRNLEVLARQGLVIKLGEHGEAARFDADLKDHYHIRCTVCGEIEDLWVEPPVANEDEIKNVSKFDLQGFKLEYFGVCPECRLEQEKN